MIKTIYTLSIRDFISYQESNNPIYLCYIRFKIIPILFKKKINQLLEEITLSLNSVEYDLVIIEDQRRINYEIKLNELLTLRQRIQADLNFNYLLEFDLKGKDLESLKNVILNDEEKAIYKSHLRKDYNSDLESLKLLDKRIKFYTDKLKESIYKRKDLNNSSESDIKINALIPILESRGININRLENMIALREYINVVNQMAKKDNNGKS